MKTKLNKAQKEFLFTTVFNGDKAEIYKIFDTCSINYLKKQTIVLGKPDLFGWIPLMVNGEEYTKLNFDIYGKEWNLIWDLK
jgi:hypothetical protein